MAGNEHQGNLPPEKKEGDAGIGEQGQPHSVNTSAGEQAPSTETVPGTPQVTQTKTLTFGEDLRELKFFADTSKWLLGALAGILFYSYDKFNCIALRNCETSIALLGIVLFFLTYHHYSKQRDLLQEKYDLADSADAKKKLTQGPSLQFKLRAFLAVVYTIAMVLLVIFSVRFLFFNEEICDEKKEKGIIINKTIINCTGAVDSCLTSGHTIPCKPVILENVLFVFDTDTLLKSSLPALNSLVDTLNAHPQFEIELSAHTDDWGCFKYNIDLSLRRAKAVVSYLESKGVASKRLTSRACGEFMPVMTNATDEGRQFNRRVEFRIVKI